MFHLSERLTNCAIQAESRKGGAFDLRAGIISLPVALGIQSNPELAAMFGKQGQFEGATFDRALQLIRDPSIVAKARALAAGQVKLARGILAQLRPSIYRESLSLLIDEQIDRQV